MHSSFTRSLTYSVGDYETESHHLSHAKKYVPPVIVKRSHLFQWKRESLNLGRKKLATLRDSHVWTLSQMADQYDDYQTLLVRLRSNESQEKGFTVSELISIATSMAFLASASGNLPWILIQVRKA